MAYVFKQGRRTALADRRQSCARESAAEAFPSCRAEDSEVKVVLTNDTPPSVLLRVDRVIE